jgi:membrane-associated phospholipid phosphatase
VSGPWRLAGLALLGLACAAASAPSRARAQDDEHRLEWSNDWARVHPASYVASTASVAGILLFEHFYDPGTEALLRGPSEVDEPVREALMARDLEDRERAATLSDILLAGLLLWPFVDAWGVAGLGDQNSDVAWQLGMVAAESYAADFVLSTVFKLFVHRSRPHAIRCSLEDRALYPERCGTGGRTRSFYSGHSSAAFNAAGVVCITHAYLPLYGSPAADGFACGTALVTASIVAVLRVIADRHHFTDIVTGATLGLLTGMLLPYLLHFGWDPIEDEPDPMMRRDPLSAPPPMMSFGGRF